MYILEEHKTDSFYTCRILNIESVDKTNAIRIMNQEINKLELLFKNKSTGVESGSVTHFEKDAYSIHNSTHDITHKLSIVPNIEIKGKAVTKRASTKAFDLKINTLFEKLTTLLEHDQETWWYLDFEVNNQYFMEKNYENASETYNAISKASQTGLYSTDEPFVNILDGTTLISCNDEHVTLIMLYNQEKIEKAYDELHNTKKDTKRGV